LAAAVANRPKRPPALREVVTQAVRCEPVSRWYFPVCWEFTGNSRILCPWEPWLAFQELQKSAISATKFPTRGTGNFEVGNSEVLFGEQRLRRAW